MRHLDREWLRKLVNDNTEFNHETGCLEWIGSINELGYGQKRIGSRGKSNLYRAHRLSYYAVYGEFTEPNINHKCDNRKCVNPLHLYAGTQQENLQDVRTRERRMGNRSPKVQGERHPMSKLSEKDVELIRFVKSEGGSLWKLHKEKYSDISYSTIKAAGNEQNWRYV